MKGTDLRLNSSELAKAGGEGEAGKGEGSLVNIPFLLTACLLRMHISDGTS
jgi:hypothetical protein